ncbi:MMPL family transporter [Luteipulveratus mongoliensis]|uniref:Membrane protein n=1 Tax=Luteipulveratus mongoliensis TaxID=571913 RepID=A0A0K1JGJ1_9MICO|nr:MMPL family transporter [Luteipulveratus mongoliensis]AKU15826.1 membrane protein [Luteipulveratus mongoliensis]
MFAKLGKGVVRHPWWVIGAWIIIAAAIIATAPKLTTSNEESDFLPQHYESIKAAQLQESKYPDATTLGGIVVIDRKDGKALTAADNAKIKQITSELGQSPKAPVSSVVAGPPAPNHLVQTLGINYVKDADAYGDDARDTIKGMRTNLSNQVKDTGLRAAVTGSTAQAIDGEEADSKSEALIGLATIGLIIVLLLIIFRSPVIALLPIVLILLVSQVATGLIAFANEAFDLNADGSISVILIIVMFGIGTDYILFLMFRYRERLRMGEDKKTAMVSSVGRVGEAIASAAGAVIAAFMALVLSSLGLFRAIGPALAIAVAVMLVAGLTLVPAVVSLLGSKVFWPSKAWKREPKRAMSARIGRSLGRRPGLYAIVTGGILIALSVFSLGFKPSFDFGSSSLPKNAESTIALDTLKKGLPAGSTDPSTVLVTSERGALNQGELTSYAARLGKVPGVGTISPPELSQDKSTATYQVTLDDDPGSDKALDVVSGPLRDAAHQSPPGTHAYVGGTTSVFVDLDDAMVRDYKVVFPVAALIIMVILALLLRSLVAPLYLMLSVGLGFGATLGATVLLIQNSSSTGGLIFMLPIYMYLFVVALGTDYNILMVARLREEAREGLSPRDAAAKAFQHAGPTVAAAGLILAGSFASLMLAGNELMVSMGFAISFGIGVAAFIMAMFFTPALTALLGHAAWWPGHGDAKRGGSSKEHPPEREFELVGTRR